MKSLAILGLSMVMTGPVAAQSMDVKPGKDAERISLSVREADLKDILRAASRGTDFNIGFEPGVETVVRGLELKDVSLHDILRQILPIYGLSFTQEGRTIWVRKGGASGMRFYNVDLLAMKRQGSKSFMVNASGQTTGGSQGSGSSSSQQGGSGQQGGGQGGNSSAYVSTIQLGNTSDPWQELEFGLTTLVFGQTPEAVASSAASGTIQGPGSKGFAKDGKSLLIHPDSGLVVVNGDEATHQKVKAYLGEMAKRSSRQVLLEARIVEVNLGLDSQIGVDWNAIFKNGAAGGGDGTDVRGLFGEAVTATPASDGAARFVVRGARVQAALNALAQEGRLQVLSAPRITTMNSQKAILRVVREDAYFLQNSQVTPGGTGGNIATVQITPMVVPVGIILDILPQIGADGMITLAVNPSVSEVVSVRTFKVDGVAGSSPASATLPVVDRRDLDTIARIRSGETLVLAGIIRARESLDDKGVPWVRRLPFIGSLFTKRTKAKTHTELAIFITPTLLDSSVEVKGVTAQAEERLQQAGAVLQPLPQKELPKELP